MEVEGAGGPGDPPEQNVVSVLLAETTEALSREARRPQTAALESGILLDGARKPVDLCGSALRWYFRLMGAVANSTLYTVDAEYMGANLDRQSVLDAHRLLVMRITALAKFYGELAEALGCRHLRAHANVFRRDDLVAACDFLLGDPATDDVIGWVQDPDSETMPAVLRLAYATGVAASSPDSQATIGMIRSALVMHSALTEAAYRSASTMMALHSTDGADTEMLTLYSIIPEVADTVSLISTFVVPMAELVERPPMWAELASMFLVSSGCARAGELVREHLAEIARDGDQTASPLYWSEKAVEYIICGEKSLFYAEWPHPAKLSAEDYQLLKTRSELGDLGAFGLFDVLGTHREVMSDVLAREAGQADLRTFLRLVAMTISTITMDVCEDTAQLFAHLAGSDVPDLLDVDHIDKLRQAFEAVGPQGHFWEVFVKKDARGPVTAFTRREIAPSPLSSILPAELVMVLCHPPAIDDAFAASIVDFQASIDASGGAKIIGTSLGDLDSLLADILA